MMNRLMENPNTASLSLLFLSSALLLWLLRDSKVRRFLKGFPGPKLWPVLGNALEFINVEEILDKVASYPERFGNRIRIIVGNDNVLALVHPDDVEKILSSQVATSKARLYHFLLPWLGNGLLLSKGQKTRARRKLIAPIFHFKVLENFQPIFNKQSQMTADIIKEKVQGGENIIQMHSLFMKCTLDIIWETAFGAKLNSQTDPNHLYAEAVAKESEYVFKRILSPWLHPETLFKWSPLGRAEKKNRELMWSCVNEAVQERKLLLKDTDLSTLNENIFFVDLLLRDQRNGNPDLDDAGVVDETNSYMFAGHDTTAANLLWTMYLLGTNLDAQDQAHAELESVFGEDKERPIDSLDLANLKYLECCVKEALRLYPSGPIYGRSLDQDFKLDDDVVLPKGLDILIAPWVTHRLPEFYPEPLEFRPSRFAPENSKGRHPYSYLPFSAGPRGCMGQKFALAKDKTILANILRSFRVRTVDDPASVVVMPELVVRPKVDIRFQFILKD